MRTTLFLSIYIVLWMLQGCTIQPVQTPKHISTDITATDTDKDQLSSDFEDEFQEEAPMPIDPLSKYNKMMTAVNDRLILYALNPVSKMYASIIPQPLRIGFSNVFKNLQFPVRFANNLLQGKIKNATEEYARFVFNSTLGLGGLFDVANTQLHIPSHYEDFGQTLGYYHVGSGFPVVLPLLGPSNLRDITGIFVDAYASPTIYTRDLSRYKIPRNFTHSMEIYTVQSINKYSLHQGEYESLKKDAIDLYPFLRDIYEQKRNNQIKE